MAVKPRDFKSLVSTNFTTRADRPSILSRSSITLRSRTRGQPAAARRSAGALNGEPLLKTQGIQGVGGNHVKTAPADIDEGFEAPAKPSGLIKPGAAERGSRRALTLPAQIAKTSGQFGIEDASA